MYIKSIEGKEETLKMWKLFKDLSVNELERVYDKLGIKFDSYEAESQYYEAGKDWVKILCDKNVAQKLYILYS
jgi:arginyl-tRNA synthetase